RSACGSLTARHPVRSPRTSPTPPPLFKEPPLRLQLVDRSALALFVAVSLWAGVSKADVSVGASPAFLDLVLDPGKTSAQTILLFNSSKDPVNVKAYAWDWWHEPNNPRKFGPPGTLPHSAARWITFIPETITVSPQKAVNVTIVVNTPADAKAG